MKINFLNNYTNHKSAYFKKQNIQICPTNQINSDFKPYYSALSSYNVAFLKRNKEQKSDEAIYVIDVYGNYRKFRDIQSVSENFKIPKDKIVKCLNGEIEHVNKLVFSSASSIEYQNKPDEFMIEVCADILKEIQQPSKPFYSIDEYLEIIGGELKDDTKIIRVRQIPNEDLKIIKERKKLYKKPFYIMDKMGNYRKFYSHAFVENTLGVGKSRIDYCLKGKCTIDGFAVALASEIESRGQKGELIIDLDKLRSKFKKKEGLYAIDKMGNYQKFDTILEASKELGIFYKLIGKACGGTRDITCGYSFLRASEVEIKDSKGHITINHDLINEKRTLLNKNAIYLINQDGYTRFDSHYDAGEKLGIDPIQILQCIEKHRKTVQGYAVAMASDVERYNKNAERLVNKAKLQKIYKASKTQERADITKNGFYAINEKGECQKFYKLLDAKNALNIKGSHISNCLKGKNFIGNGYAFAYAEDIETMNENGEIIIDKAKVADKIQSTFRRNIFYAIDKFGNCTLFEKQNDARDAFGISHGSIGECLAKKQKYACGYAFIAAAEIEDRDENGEIIFKQDVIENAIKDIIEYELYAIDKDGNFKRFDNRADAIKMLGISATAICDVIAGRRKYSKGWTFVNAYDFETRYKDGTIVTDEDKIKELAVKNFAE